MKSNVTIRYVSGREENYEVELWGGGGTGARLKEFVSAPNLALHIKDELVIIPSSAVECISVDLPKSHDFEKGLAAVRRARRLDKK